jgi:hypothetical protein
MSRFLICGLLFPTISVMDCAGARADEPSDDRVRFLIASLDRPIKEIKMGWIALPDLADKLGAQASLPGADKDPKKRVIIVVSVHPLQPVFAGEQKPAEIWFATDIVGTRLRDALNQICLRIDGVAMIRDDFIEIVPRLQAFIECGLKIPEKVVKQWKKRADAERLRLAGPFLNGGVLDDFQPPMPPLVHCLLTKVPLQKALEQIAEHDNQNIVLALQAQVKCGTLVTARLVNVPIETAVETLANMADLRVVRRANVFLVTTKELAAELNK